jgi:hypothetical protein
MARISRPLRRLDCGHERDTGGLFVRRDAIVYRLLWSIIAQDCESVFTYLSRFGTFLLPWYGYRKAYAEAVVIVPGDRRTWFPDYL